MRTDFIKELNRLFSAFQKDGREYEKNVGKGTSYESAREKILKVSIPHKLEEVFSVEKFKIKGSIGQGRICKCPWVAIMDKKETLSTKRGVYLVFLFSTDLSRIYLSLGLGVSEITMAEINKTREKIRKDLKLESNFLRHFNDQLLDSKEYKAGAIYSNEWDITNDDYCKALLLQFKGAYEEYISRKYSVKKVGIPDSQTTIVGNNKSVFSIKPFVQFINKTGLYYSDFLIKRFTVSLLTKPFVILSGLSGSGKTQLSIAVAKALCEDCKKQIRVVPVGADWTNREPLLGYPDSLQDNRYVPPESRALQLLLAADKDKSHPYFLILDEMNLSYVERYFADFLSALESHQPIPLWTTKDDSIPQAIDLPKNLFIIGTINVDETTYMFSPKVLDRANVIEFTVSETEMSDFLNQAPIVNVDAIEGAAAAMAEDFVRIANDKVSTDTVNSILLSFFKELKKVNAEFGYRSASEIGRYIALAKSVGGLKEDEAFDSAIVQKLLPKLHGSRKKLVPVLKALWDLCETNEKLDDAKTVPANTKYPLTADKLLRMFKSAVDNGFTSFSEA